jgi:hypothetical protein
MVQELHHFLVFRSHYLLDHITELSRNRIGKIHVLPCAESPGGPQEAEISRRGGGMYTDATDIEMAVHHEAGETYQATMRTDGGNFDFG